jgi:hypothetical protein
VGAADNHPAAEAAAAAGSPPGVGVGIRRGVDTRQEAVGVDIRRGAVGVDIRRGAVVVDRSSGLPEIVGV